MPRETIFATSRKCPYARDPVRKGRKGLQKTQDLLRILRFSVPFFEGVSCIRRLYITPHSGVRIRAAAVCYIGQVRSPTPFAVGLRIVLAEPAEVHTRLRGALVPYGKERALKQIEPPLLLCAFHHTNAPQRR